MSHLNFIISQLPFPLMLLGETGRPKKTGILAFCDGDMLYCPPEKNICL